MTENSTFKETDIYDYIPKLKEQFPTLSKSDIRKILQYGWRSLYLANLAGCDTLVVSSKYKYWFYIGDLTKDSIKHFNYYRRQLIRKIKFLYKRKKIEWDGYYYTGLNSEECKQFDTSKGGRPKSKFNFSNKVIFKSKDMCDLYYYSLPGLIKFKYVTDVGINKFYRNINIQNPEIIPKDLYKFKDILVSNKEYELI